MSKNSQYGLTISSAILTKLQSHPFVGCVVQEMRSHIVSTNGGQKEYKRRHDSVGRYVHWQFYEKLGFDRARLWYEHEPENVVNTCDHMLEGRRPNIMVVGKVKKETVIIDMAIP